MRRRLRLVAKHNVLATDNRPRRQLAFDANLRAARSHVGFLRTSESSGRFVIALVLTDLVRLRTKPCPKRKNEVEGFYNHLSGAAHELRPSPWDMRRGGRLGKYGEALVG
jgi:hypothetical protein